MPRPRLEIADIFRTHGPAWRRAHAGHVSLTQLKVMSAIEACRTEALGGHVASCLKCGHRHVSYSSCKNRHCLKCQAARDWMAARAEDLLPLEYFHVVFTLPAEIARIACWNKKTVYDLMFRVSAETVMTIAADPKRLGARVGMTSVLHTWGSALTHHPHIHMIFPGGGLSLDGARWVPCRPGFFLPVRVLSRGFAACSSKVCSRCTALARWSSSAMWRRDHPAHAARTMPLLWRPDGHRRDVPSRQRPRSRAPPPEQAA